jgi:hypothetical protein
MISGSSNKLIFLFLNEKAEREYLTIGHMIYRILGRALISTFLSISSRSFP